MSCMFHSRPPPCDAEPSDGGMLRVNPRPATPGSKRTDPVKPYSS